VTIPFPDPPPGAVRHGYEDYFVQELVLHGQVTRYRRERLRTPDGRTLLAPLPDGKLLPVVVRSCQAEFSLLNR
jgi:hypothetical protein